MSVTTDIVQSYRRPRAVMRRLLQAGQREDRAIALLMGGCVLLFISQWPARAREAHLTGQELVRLMANDLFALIFFLPLVMYGIAALTHLIARVFGGAGTWYGARLALFWSLLASSPLIVFAGLIKGFIGPGSTHMAVGAVWFALFMVFWVANLWEAETYE